MPQQQELELRAREDARDQAMWDVVAGRDAVNPDYRLERYESTRLNTLESNSGLEGDPMDRRDFMLLAANRRSGTMTDVRPGLVTPDDSSHQAGLNGKSSISTDYLNRTIDDGDGNVWTHNEYIESIRSKQLTGTASDPEIRQAQRLLYDYGYRLGTLDGDRSSLVGGVTGVYTRETGRAVQEFLANERSDPEDHAFRYQVYSRIQETPDNGRMVKVMSVSENGSREITLNWTGGPGEAHFANRAMIAGVSADEALRKTDWFVLKQVINAGFATPDVESITINGAWRPARYGGEHPDGSSLDIQRINNERINRDVGAESRLLANFTDNLRLQPGASSIYQPWRMWGGNTGQPIWSAGVDNNLRRGLHYDHRNHLHFQARR